jgi:hypothetical protein
VSSRKFWLACLAYFGLTVLMFWPLVRDLRTGVPHDIGDPLLNTWILWWNAHAVPFTQGWWNGPAYWPLPDFLALSEHLVGLSVVSTPPSGSAPGRNSPQPRAAAFVAVVNIATHAPRLASDRRHDAAFIAGLVPVFNLYRLGRHHTSGGRLLVDAARAPALHRTAVLQHRRAVPARALWPVLAASSFQQRVFPLLLLCAGGVVARLVHSATQGLEVGCSNCCHLVLGGVADRPRAP